MQLSKEAEMPRDLSEPLDPSGGAFRIADLPAQVTPTRGHSAPAFHSAERRAGGGIHRVAGLGAAEPALRSPGIVGILGALALLNSLTWLRLKQSVPVSYNQFFAADPRRCRAPVRGDVRLGRRRKSLEDLYFVPLAIAAATLPWRHTLVAAAAIVGCRELASRYYIPCPRFLRPSTRWSNCLRSR
jgi:hypothetical protein